MGRGLALFAVTWPSPLTLGLFDSLNTMKSSNSRLGLKFFLLYLLLYGGFVGLSAFSPDAMEMMPLAGINLAIVYGFFLIVSAFVLALIYGKMCDPGAKTDDAEEKP